MRLKDAAHKFDTTQATDPYGSGSINIQFEPLLYNKIDGVAVKKRQISTFPETIIPKRRVLVIDGHPYLVGYASPDVSNNETIRSNYFVQGATGVAGVTTISKELAGTTRQKAYAALTFAKYLPDTEDSSRYPPQYEIFFSITEDVMADSLLFLNDSYFLVKQSYISDSGLLVALSNKVDDPFESASFSDRTYDPLTDSNSSVDTTVPVFRIKWSEHFKYLSKASATYERGDIQILMLKTKSPVAADLVTLSDGVWRIISVQDEGALWSCHARRA